MFCTNSGIKHCLFVWSIFIFVKQSALKLLIVMKRSKIGPSKWLNSQVYLYLRHSLFEIVNHEETKQAWTIKMAKLLS